MVQKQQDGAPTSIEVLGYEMLDRIGEPYTPQKLLFSKFCVDACLDELPLVIQFDGDYWHGHPERFPEPDERQQRRIHLDRSQDAYLRKCGYTILRIWECDIHGDMPRVRRRVRRAIARAKVRAAALQSLAA